MNVAIGVVTDWNQLCSNVLNKKMLKISLENFYFIRKLSLLFLITLSLF